MSRVTLTSVKKQYGELEVIHGIDLSIDEGEFCVFVGPSGCGKSTLLRMIAGLEDTTAGQIAIGDRDVTKEVLMMAWMNQEAVVKTLATGRVTYWSRSRQAFWIKGETSGHTQELVEFRYDCDADAILVLVNQTGAACHTNRRHCFYRAVQDGAVVELIQPMD